MADIPPEVLAAAERLGFKVGDWSATGDRPIGSGVAEKERGLLLRLKGAMEQAQAKDMQTVAELREKLARLERGGGT